MYLCLAKWWVTEQLSVFIVMSFDLKEAID